jgi:exopolysaccharide biosynthesis protein
MLVETDVTPSGTDEGEYLAIVRCDPSAVRFHVHYDPSQPLKVSTWAEQLQSLLVVNGGYFTPEYETTGLLISDGQTWGAVYGDFAGLFAVTADGQVSVRWLRDRPYDPAEPLTQGVMSFPVLVKPGGAMGFPADADDGTSARRTVVAQDSEGRILFIAAPRGHLSLHEMAVFLAESDMEIDVALNLDGGPSTGLWLTAEESPVGIDSRAAVPSVISVKAR